MEAPCNKALFEVTEDMQRITSLTQDTQSCLVANVLIFSIRYVAKVLKPFKF